MQFFKIEAEMIFEQCDTPKEICVVTQKGKKIKTDVDDDDNVSVSFDDLLKALSQNDDENRKSNEMSYEDKKLLQTRLSLFLDKHGKDCLFCICSMRYTELLMLGVTIGRKSLVPDFQGELCVEKKLPAFLREAGIKYHNVKIEEITFSGARALINLSSENHFIGSRSEELYNKLEIDALSNSGYNGSDIKFTEDMINILPDKEKTINEAVKLLCCGSLVPELERIYTPAKRLCPGHPVHYIIQTDDDEVGEKITQIILSALYSNKRLQSRKYCTANLKGEWCWGTCDTDVCKALYKTCEGGAIAVKMVADIQEDDDLVSAEVVKVEQACSAALKHRNTTLTIFRLPRAAERIKAIMREHLDTMTLVEINEDAVSHDEAKAFLRQSARNHKIRVDKALYKCLDDPLKTYSISELHQAFRNWYDNQLKTKCYTQYADFETAGKLASKTSKLTGDAGKELEKMIGLGEAKSVIYEAVDYFKAQRIFKDRGISTERPAMHMVFTGSPGTAKTTVARLFAKIMKDNGLLSIGSMVEVGRGDLVGKYVGWTAQIVKKKFAEAKGSVLFIDEAYSLVDDRDGSFGDEAINTIVQEMENRRDDIVVIFAGYTDKMEAFLQKNPGLRSRIAFHVPFADYSTEELLEILIHLATKQSMSIDDSAKDKLIPILEASRKHTDFGNGRFMRNLLERARMKQASRLLSMDIDKVKKAELTTLVADDFEAPPELRKDTKAIGFCV